MSFFEQLEKVAKALPGTFLPDRQIVSGLKKLVFDLEKSDIGELQGKI